MAAIYADFETSRTLSLDSWGYFDDTKPSGTALKNSALERLLRNFHLACVIRDLRYALANRNEPQHQVGLPGSTSTCCDSTVAPSRRAFPRSLDPNEPNQPIPSPGLEENLAILRDRLEEDGVPFVNLFALREEFSLEDFRASRFDDHPSPLVHQRIAEKLAREIQGRRLLAQLRQLEGRFPGFSRRWFPGWALRFVDP